MQREGRPPARPRVGQREVRGRRGEGRALLSISRHSHPNIGAAIIMIDGMGVLLRNRIGWLDEERVAGSVINARFGFGSRDG